MYLEEWRVPTPDFPSRSAIWMRFECDGCRVIFEHQGGAQIKAQRRHFCTRRCKYDCMAKDVEYKQKLKSACAAAYTAEKRAEHSKLMREYYVVHPDKIPSVSGARHWAYGQVLPWWRPWMSENPTINAWIRAVKRMCGHVCGICGATKQLHAHHVVPISYRPELTYDLNNGVVLCHRCHMGKTNPNNVHRILREDPERYRVLMQELLLRRTL